MNVEGREKKDLVRVKVRRSGSRVLEDFLLRPSSAVKLNGQSAVVAGRFGKDGTDRPIEVSEIYFPDQESFGEFCDLLRDYKLPLGKSMFEMTGEDIRAHARREAANRAAIQTEMISRHPNLKIMPSIFPAARQAS